MAGSGLCVKHTSAVLLYIDNHLDVGKFNLIYDIHSFGNKRLEKKTETTRQR